MLLFGFILHIYHMLIAINLILLYHFHIHVFYRAIACVAIIVTIAIVASVGNTPSRSKRGSSKESVRAKAAFGEFRFGAIADDSGVCGQIGT